MPTRRELIRNKAVELLKNNPDGYRYADLHRELIKLFPEFPLNTIQGSTWNLDVVKSEEVSKPSRGLFKYKFSKDKIQEIESIEQQKVEQIFHIKEEDFYQSFADWIKNDLGECTEAVALGRNSLGKKWVHPIYWEFIKHPKEMLFNFSQK